MQRMNSMQLLFLKVVRFMYVGRCIITGLYIILKNSFVFRSPEYIIGEMLESLSCVHLRVPFTHTCCYHHHRRVIRRRTGRCIIYACFCLYLFISSSCLPLRSQFLLLRRDRNCWYWPRHNSLYQIEQLRDI